LVSEVFVDESARQITAPAGGLGDMTRIAAAFEHSTIEIDDLGLKRPSLDDVFLALTGHRTDAATAAPSTGATS
jgi:ABC-2 type transport system ATP-binding protein